MAPSGNDVDPPGIDTVGSNCIIENDTELYPFSEPLQIVPTATYTTTPTHYHASQFSIPLRI